MIYFTPCFVNDETSGESVVCSFFLFGELGGGGGEAQSHRGVHFQYAIFTGFDWQSSVYRAKMLSRNICSEKELDCLVTEGMPYPTSKDPR